MEDQTVRDVPPTTPLAGNPVEPGKTIPRNPAEPDRGSGSLATDFGATAQQMARRAGDTAQDLARRAREQTGVAGDTLYQQGARAGQYLTRNVNEYPVAALLIAGMVGYGLAFLIHRSWSGEG